MTIQDALDYCLENPEGLSAQELLDKFPAFREDLASLLGLAAGVRSLKAPSVPGERRAAMKARLMAAASEAAAQDDKAALAGVAGGRAGTAYGPPSTARRERRVLPWLLRPRWVALAAALVLVAFVWWLSARALPDNPLYGVRLVSENVTTLLAGSNADKARAQIRLADNRLYDLRTMQTRAELADTQSALDNYASHLDSAMTLWHGLSGDDQVAVARLLYASSVAGDVTFGGFGAAVDNLPASIQDKIKRIEASLATVNSETERTLTAANIAPANALDSVDGDIAALLTPVASASNAVPTNTATTEPGAEGASPTPITAAEATATRVAETKTAVAVRSATPRNGPPGEPVSTATIAATRTATVSPVRTRTPTTTPTHLVSATPTVAEGEATPTLTDTPVLVPTMTPTPGTPENTATAIATMTAVLPEPTDTPVPPIPSPTYSPTPLPPASPTVPVVPSNTPVQPTATALPLPSATSVPPSATPVPPGDVCQLRIIDITSSCQSASSVSWEATVNNPVGGVSANWTATLQILRRGGGYQDAVSRSGTRLFQPGDTSVSGTITYNFPADTQRVRVKFSIETSGHGCPVPSRLSQPMQPCSAVP